MIDIYSNINFRIKAQSANTRAIETNTPGIITKEEMEDLFSQSDGNCALCDKPFKLGDKIAIDHIIPFSHKDCTNTIDNVQIVHFTCNQIKKDRDNYLARLLCRSLGKIKHCPECDRILPIEDFHTSSKVFSGKQWRCKECCNRIERARYYANRDYIRKRQQAYYEKNKERIKTKAREQYHRRKLQKSLEDL